MGYIPNINANYQRAMNAVVEAIIPFIDTNEFPGLRIRFPIE